MAAQEPPWSVEVPESALKMVVGPDGSTLQRLSKATRCELEVSNQRQRGRKVVHFQGQRQVVDDDAGASSNAPVKIFIRGGPKQRMAAAEAIRGVAEGDDPEDHAARAEGGLVLAHGLQHPDREAWVRWRLLAVGHEHGVRAHLSAKMLRICPRPGEELAPEAAESALVAAKAVVEDARGLSEVPVSARCELEPEDAPSDPALAALIEQHGIIIRVADEDDNNVNETVTVRVVGPEEPARDAAALLTARFVEGKATASVLQASGQVQSMSAGMAADFGHDLACLEIDSKVKVHKGRTVLWIVGESDSTVTAAKKTLQEMLSFYLPEEFALVQGLQAEAVQRLYEDLELGAMMARPGCAVALDEGERAAWLCGKHCAAVRRCIDAVARLTEAPQGEPPAKRRRTDALTCKGL